MHSQIILIERIWVYEFMSCQTSYAIFVYMYNEWIYRGYYKVNAYIKFISIN